MSDPQDASRRAADTPLPDDVTLLIQRMQSGSAADAETLYRHLYNDLRGLAHGIMSRERGDHTLDATALVHEAWMKIGQGGERPFEARGQFMAVAAKAMRHVLVDHARARKALKRGGSAERVALENIEDPVEAQAQTFLLVDEALKRLATSDPLAAQVGELRLFGGLEHAEIAEQVQQSLRGVERTWRFVRAVLRKELGDTYLADD